MKTIRTLRVAIVAVTAVVSASFLRADDPTAKFAIEVGAAFGELDAKSDGTADLTGLAAAFNLKFGKVLFTDMSLRVDYTHLESGDTLEFQRDNLDADLRFGMTFIGILKPYVGIGMSYGDTNSPSYAPDDDWGTAPAFSLGCCVSILPNFLDITPSVRYVSYENLETVTYTLDTAVHFAALGVGLRLNFEDNQDRGESVSSGVLYASLRF